MTTNYKIVLASASPRRSEILKNAGFDFTVRVSNADETLPEGISPENAVKLLAEIKASAVERNKGEIIIGADTVVCLDDKILGKPKNYDEAFEMLKSLSGRSHFVYTGVCGITDSDKICFAEKTEVTFSEMTDKEISGYIETGDCFDKAGGYGIQGYASRFITGIKGDYFNVVGLPIGRIYKKILEKT